jgi:hypothetical protein
MVCFVNGSRCVEDVLDEVDSEGVEYARALADLLADDNSALISFEDIFRPQQLAVWLRTLREVGIYVPAGSLDVLGYEVVEYDYFALRPVSIGTKQVAEPPSAVEIRSLWTPIDGIPEQDSYEDTEAESILMATEPKELCCEVFNDSYNDDEISRTELWAAESHVLIYNYDAFDRKLVRLPAADPKRHIELLIEVFDEKDNN